MIQCGWSPWWSHYISYGFWANYLIFLLLIIKRFKIKRVHEFHVEIRLENAGLIAVMIQCGWSPWWSHYISYGFWANYAYYTIYLSLRVSFQSFVLKANYQLRWWSNVTDHHDDHIILVTDSEQIMHTIKFIWVFGYHFSHLFWKQTINCGDDPMWLITMMITLN